MTTKKKAATTIDKSTLRITHDKEKTKDRQLAEVAQDSLVLNTITARLFTQKSLGGIDVNESLNIMREKVSDINTGNISGLEATLTAQVVSLDAIFNELARRSALNMGEYMSAAESYMRLALKAQSQCSRTIETLAAIKNPPIIYAKQANISHGHQQVNNQTDTCGHAHAWKNINQPNELLEHQQNGEWLDSGKTETASGIDQKLETVGEKHRS